jgi:hypothetical protein
MQAVSPSKASILGSTFRMSIWSIQMPACDARIGAKWELMEGLWRRLCALQLGIGLAALRPDRQPTARAAAELEGVTPCPEGVHARSQECKAGARSDDEHLRDLRAAEVVPRPFPRAMTKMVGRRRQRTSHPLT